MISQRVLTKRFIPVVIQRAEAHRKPRWLPVAKSKIYRIPKRPEVSEDERIELKRITNNYHTQMRAIRRFYHEEMIKDKSTKEDASSETSLRLEAEEWSRCVELNEQWNLEVAAERAARRASERERLHEYALDKMQRDDERHRARVAAADQLVRQEKQRAASFITPDTLDEAIDRALANPIDYNFAIDLKGNQIIGRDTLITPPKEQAETTTQSNT